MFALRLVYFTAVIPLSVFISNGTVPKLRAVLLVVVIVTGVPLVALDLATKVKNRRTHD